MLKNKMDADDVTQEVMIRIWKNMDKFNILAAKAWVIKTTHNLCIDYLRRRKTVMTRETGIDEYFEETYEAEHTNHDPLIKTHLAMMTSKIKEAITKLPETLRSVFVLYEIQGFKYREISNSLGLPINTVKVYIMRARKKLQEELKNYEPHEV